ncbi:hypothetical protein MKX01_035748, partial [Papaver californicum]
MVAFRERNVKVFSCIFIFAGIVYTTFSKLNPDQTTQKAVKALVLKMWRFESKKSGQMWSIELHLIDHNVSNASLRVIRFCQRWDF